MRPIGGEIEVKLEDKIFYTDSGRSSLRLFCKEMKPKKVLLPDFLCEVIIKTFESENISYSFYHINEDLTIDFDSVSDDFDVFYFINYFGVNQNIDKNFLKDKIIVEDNVFFYNFENRGFKNWFSFNSYRKITNLADGSLIKTNLDIKNELIEDNSVVSNYKYQAKNLKYDYIFKDRGNESNYLKLFEKGEKLLDNQCFIRKISNESIYLLSLYEYTTIQQIRKKRFEKLYNLFSDFCLNKNPKEYSFFVMKINNRDIIRKKLFEYKIFLPIHWPKVTNNVLYDKIISIPLFENYTDKEFEYMLNILKKVFNEYK